MTDNMRSIGEAESALSAAEAARILYVFDVPAQLASATGIKELAFVELTSGEELMATKRSTTAGQLAYELAKECLREADGKKLSTADGSADEFWARRVAGMANVRQLAINAYSNIHVPREEVVKGFLESRRMRTR